jgi:hypothetical protein
MLRVLLAHPQEVLYKRNLMYCVRVMSVGCTTIGVPEYKILQVYYHVGHCRTPNRSAWKQIYTMATIKQPDILTGRRQNSKS